MTASLPRNGAAPMIAALDMGGNKIVGITNGSVATDAAAFGQITGLFTNLPESIKVADYTILLADAGTALIANKATAITFTLPALVGAAAKPYWVRNIGAGDLTLDGNAAEQIEGAASIVLRQGDAALVWPNGTLWRAFISRRKATQAEAEAGTAADLIMDPQRVKQSVIFGSGIVGGFSSLVITATSDTSVTLTAAALCLVDASNFPIILRNVNLTADISVLANRLDGAAEAASTWYEVGVIVKADGTTPLLAFCKSGSSPTLPTGYVAWRRFGSVRNNASSNLWRSVQYNRFAQIIVGTNPVIAPVLASGTIGTFGPNNVTLASVSLAGFVPPTASAAFINVSSAYTAFGTSGNIMIAPNTNWGGTNNGPEGSAGQNYPAYYRASGAPGSSMVRVSLEALSFAQASSGNAASSIMAWEDNL